MVRKSDFNENPVVSLDLDFGLRLRVCQFPISEPLLKCLCFCGFTKVFNFDLNSSMSPSFYRLKGSSFHFLVKCRRNESEKVLSLGGNISYLKELLDRVIPAFWGLGIIFLIKGLI